MKNKTILKLKSLFGSKSKGKRHHKSRTPSPGASSQQDEAIQQIVRTPPPPARIGPPPSPPVPTSPVAPTAPQPSGPLHLTPCQVCGRTFLPQTLQKHVKICEKTSAKKRKMFDSSRQRREGTDLAQFLPKNFGLPENSPFLEKSPPPTAKVMPKPKPTVRSVIKKPTADLQRCPHCNRTFGHRAFERHVEWCADKAKILPSAPAQPSSQIADAKNRLNARTQYKAPLARGRRSSQSRDKSSNSRSASVESSRGTTPPREYGDYRQGRVRASESMSSNDCHEDASPHVPVIKSTRSSMNNLSCDANVKARQARLARDLSNTRLNENYDPFLSAAKQMKELMSSETNIPQKLESSTNDHNRTLPILRPSRDKTTASQLRQETTKTLKDSINRTYQKTPTLQRMKSVGINDTNSFGGRCSSFRLKNSKNNTIQLNTTFTKSNKDNISPTDKNAFNRTSALNRSFSSYSNSCYSTPKPKDKIPKISTSMYHSFQRTTVKQTPKTDINTPSIHGETNGKKFVNLDAILINDNISLNDSTYIDPRLINENDNLPINVNNILSNPEIISSMESLLNSENLPAKFESFNTLPKTNNIVAAKENNISSSKESQLNKLNGINKTHGPIIDDLSAEYDKIMSTLEKSITSKVSIRDDDSLCEDFDLDEFMTNFDEELNKPKSDEKRMFSSTTRIIKQSDIVDSNKNSNNNSGCPTPKLPHCNGNGTIPFNKSISLNFSTNNNASDPPFLSSFKRSASLLDSIQKKNPTTRNDSTKNRHKVDELENELMQSLKDFDTVYENDDQRNKNAKHNNQMKSIDTKKSARMKPEKNSKKLNDNTHSGNINGNGKPCNDSAYSSLNRISPSKLSVYNSKEVNGTEGPVASDSSNGTHRDNDIRSVSSEEFLAMERSAELDGPIMPPQEKSVKEDTRNEKRQPSRSTSRQSSAWHRPELSSSGSETSIHKAPREPAPRFSRFCHECGNKFPVHTAKFCIECGVKRLLL